MSMNKEQALDLLGDLIGIAPRTDLFGETVKKAKPTPRPKWTPIAVVALYKTTRCDCGAIHTEVNPLVMIHEQLIAADGRILSDQKTSNPDSVITNLPEALPSSVEYYEMPEVHFCVDCVENLIQTDLLKLFRAQRKAEAIKESGEAMLSAVDKKLKAEEAEKKLLQLAASLEAGGLRPATTDEIRLENSDNDTSY